MPATVKCFVATPPLHQPERLDRQADRQTGRQALEGAATTVNNNIAT
jgi:hypothetical protein